MRSTRAQRRFLANRISTTPVAADLPTESLAVARPRTRVPSWTETAVTRLRRDDAGRTQKVKGSNSTLSSLAGSIARTTVERRYSPRAVGGADEYLVQQLPRDGVSRQHQKGALVTNTLTTRLSSPSSLPRSTCHPRGRRVTSSGMNRHSASTNCQSLSSVTDTWTDAVGSGGALNDLRVSGHAQPGEHTRAHTREGRTRRAMTARSIHRRPTVTKSGRAMGRAMARTLMTRTMMTPMMKMTSRESRWCAA